MHLQRSFQTKNKRRLHFPKSLGINLHLKHTWVMKKPYVNLIEVQVNVEM